MWATRSTASRRRALALDLRRAYGRVPARAGVCYFFPRPSNGSACKRLNLFLRWMVRRDALDLGVWSSVSPAQLVVPLDTHVIRVGTLPEADPLHQSGVGHGARHHRRCVASIERSGEVRLRDVPSGHDERLRLRNVARRRTVSARGRVRAAPTTRA